MRQVVTAAIVAVVAVFAFSVEASACCGKRGYGPVYYGGGCGPAGCAPAPVYVPAPQPVSYCAPTPVYYGGGGCCGRRSFGGGCGFGGGFGGGCCGGGGRIFGGFGGGCGGGFGGFGGGCCR
jgi:hypothetical protein